MRKICTVIRRFWILPVLKRKKKVAAFSATLPLAGFVGSERQNGGICLKSFSNRVSGSERNAGKIPAPPVEGISKRPHRGSRHCLRASIDQCTKFRFRSICYPGLTCWGVPSPNPAYAACAALYSAAAFCYGRTQNRVRNPCLNCDK